MFLLIVYFSSLRSRKLYFENSIMYLFVAKKNWFFQKIDISLQIDFIFNNKRSPIFYVEFCVIIFLFFAFYFYIQVDIFISF